MNKPTWGETRVMELCRQLPPDEFFCYAEPRIDSTTQTSRYPDFVIVWRSKGVLCIEVKDWRDIVDGTSEKVTVRRTDGQLIRPDNPFDTASGYKDSLMQLLNARRELLRKHESQEKLRFPIDPLVILAGMGRERVSWLQAVKIFPDYNVMCADDIVSVNELIRALNRVRWTFTLKQPMPDEMVEVISHTLRMEEVRTKESEKVGELTPEQDSIVWAPLLVKRGISKEVVRGVVGSGKTVVLSKKARQIATLRPDLKILISAFNKDLATELRSRVPDPKVRVIEFYDLVAEILGEAWPKTQEYRGRSDPKPIRSWLKEVDYDFLPIDFVAMEIARRKDLNLTTSELYRADLRKRNADLNQDEIEAVCLAYDEYKANQKKLQDAGEPWQDYEDTVTMALKEIHGHRYHHYFDIVMVDEGQDLSPNAFRLLQSLLKTRESLLFVCDDPMQSLWREFDLNDKGLAGAKKWLLRLPLRTTRKIAEAAQSLIELVPEMQTADYDDIYPAPTDHLQMGETPRLIQFSSADTKYAHIFEWIRTELEHWEDDECIAVLTPNFDASLSEEIQRFGERVYYGGFNRMKGLEFASVLIPHLDDLFRSDWNQRVIMRRWLFRKLFVAMTRARHRLTVSFVGELPSDLKPLEYYFDVLTMPSEVREQDT